MINRFRVIGLNDRINFDQAFFPDINLITGKNGSGKTTILKLMWYLLSGNVERIWPEMKFREVELDTTAFNLRIERVITKRPKTPATTKALRRLTAPVRLNWTFKLKNSDAQEWKDTIRPRENPDRTHDEVAYGDLNRLIMNGGDKSSLFFPTFRRIEGGFGMTMESDGPMFGLRSIGNAIADLARTLSVNEHRFIASISTQDIVMQLTSRYAAVSEILNRENQELTSEISDMINSSESASSDDGDSAARSAETLNQIRKLTSNHAELQKHMLSPFDTLSDMIASIFVDKGIRLSEGLTLGGSTLDAIESKHLSSGEKQMLSFLAYNAFEKDSIIFIDEPEISLHVDWQRILFKKLMEQGKSNQFIITTHSPFIYSKYSDKELLLVEDRGDSSSEGEDGDSEANA